MVISLTFSAVARSTENGHVQASGNALYVSLQSRSREIGLQGPSRGIARLKVETFFLFATLPLRYLWSAAGDEDIKTRFSTEHHLWCAPIISKSPTIFGQRPNNPLSEYAIR
jgi:hypothetical protein